VIAEHLPSAASASCFSSIPNPEAEPSLAVSTKHKACQRSLDKATIDNIPSLAEFMHRSKVLKQYRSFVWLAIFLDGQNGGTGECHAALEEVRVAYRLGVKKGTDSLSRSMAFSEGQRIDIV
jgi:hypothetical protein